MPQPDYNPLASKMTYDTSSIAKQAAAAFQQGLQNFWQYTVEAFDAAIGIDPSTFLPNVQTQLGGFSSLSSILAQLIGAGGGNSSATNLLAEYAATFEQAVSSGDWSNLLTSLYNETATALDTIWPGAVPLIDASKIGSGTLSPTLLPMIPQTQITNLETSLGALLPTSTWQAFINDVVGGTAGDYNALVSWLNGVDTAAYNAVTTGNYNGLLTALFGGTTIATTVQPAAVPLLDASKVNTGLFGSSLIPNITAGTGPGQSADLLTHFNAVSAAAGSVGSSPLGAANQGIDLIASTLNALAAQMQQNATQSTGATNNGQSLNINFNQYSTWSAVPVNTTYGNIPGASSHGSGHFVISNGDAAWSEVNDGDVSAISIFNGAGGQAFTNTDYQKLYASLAGFPNGAGSKNFALLRANAITNPSDYVYGVVFLNSGLALQYEIGCYISGVQHVWATGPVSVLNLNFTMDAGVGNNPARYQGYSGDTQVFDFINDGSHGEAIFPIDSSHRYWGFRSDTYNNGQVTPAPASYVGCADNTPPSVPGSGIRTYRTGTASITQNTATGGVSLFSNGGSGAFFDAASENSPDVTQFTGLISGVSGVGLNAIQVANADRYIVGIRSIISAATCSSGAVSICPVVSRYNSAGTLQEERFFGSPGFFSNGFGGQYNTGFFGGTEAIACQAGDILIPGYFLSPGPAGTGAMSALSFTGESSGSQTYFEVTLAN